MTYDIYADGQWRPSAGADRLWVINPATEERIGDVPQGAPEDVDVAVAAARRALPEWSARTPQERASLVSKLADHLEQQLAELTDTVVAEVGTPRRVASWAQVGYGIADLREAAAAVDEVEWEKELGHSLVVREAVGVVGCITPWNYPLHQITAKVGAALVAGCTVVVKASEVAPLTARALTRAVHDVGFPPGTFNLVNGTGAAVGEALAAHHDVDMISFTGSNAIGKRVSVLAAATVKRVALELGGKSASILHDDADLGPAVEMTVRSCFMNAGQSCSAQSRMLVPRSMLSEVEGLVREAVSSYVPGDPTDSSTRLGPLVTASQRRRVAGYVQRGIDDGARLVVGGPDRPAGRERGFYVQPTVFSDVDPLAVIAQEEIFGPVLSMIPYDSDDEALDIANCTIFGIAGAVWSRDEARARTTARRMQTAQVEVNGGAFNLRAPFGGYKQSGLGREGGAYGVEEFLETKALQLARR